MHEKFKFNNCKQSRSSSRIFKRGMWRSDYSHFEIIGPQWLRRFDQGCLCSNINPSAWVYTTHVKSQSKAREIWINFLWGPLPRTLSILINRLPGPSCSSSALLSFIHWRKALTDESPPDGTVASHILYSFSKSSRFNPKAENRDSHSNDTQELTVCILKAGDENYHRKSLKWIKKGFTLNHSRSLEEERGAWLLSCSGW